MTSVEIQVAIDTTDVSLMLTIADAAVRAGITILEIGTPALAAMGVEAIRIVRRRHPAVSIYADLKTIDFPDLELPLALRAGANTVSILAGATDECVARSLAITHEREASLAISTMGIPVQNLRERMRVISQLGDALVVAHGVGRRTHDAYSDMMSRLTLLRDVATMRIIAAGGVDHTNIVPLLSRGVERIIVGRGVVQNADVEGAARRLLALVHTRS